MTDVIMISDEPEGLLWKDAYHSDDKERAGAAKDELRRRGVLAWCPECKSDCFVMRFALLGTCRGCGARVLPFHVTTGSTEGGR